MSESVVLSVISIIVIVVASAIIDHALARVLDALARADIKDEAMKLVLAVEQVYGHINNESKRSLVEKKLSEFLSGMNIQLSPEQIGDLIESSVKHMKLMSQGSQGRRDGGQS